MNTNNNKIRNKPYNLFDYLVRHNWSRRLSYNQKCTETKTLEKIFNNNQIQP